MNNIMEPKTGVGIVGYGAYIPRLRLSTREISLIWRGGRDIDNLPVEYVSLHGADEDVVTMSIEATQNALYRADINKAEIRSLYVGSESHPYSVKSTSSIVAEVLGITPNTCAADFQFGSKAGTEAIQAGFSMVGSGMANYSVGIGVDSAQAKPGDELEYTAAAAAAAIVVGPADESVAVLEASFSYVTDTPDFFRRSNQIYPEYVNRFTGSPGYFHHIESAVTTLLDETGLKPSDFAHVIFHQPNVRFPKKIAKILGFESEQLKTGLLAQEIGNTYSSSAILGFTAVLDEAKPGDRILLASYGAGAGSDVFCFIVTEKINQASHEAPSTRSYIDRVQQVDYLTYARLKGKFNNN